MKKQFEIESYVYSARRVVVTYSIPNVDTEKVFGFPRSAFEKWLEDNGRLYFEEDPRSPEEVGHEKCYSIKAEDYFDCVSEKDIHWDLHDYILSHDDTVFDAIEDSIHQILSDYQN